MDSSRLITLDRLRVLSALLRCVLHALIPYMATRTGMWPFKENNQTLLLPDVLVFNIHSFIMEAFFMLSGFLALQQWQKYGARYFVKERAMRVGIPFVIGLLLLIPMVVFMFPWGEAWQSQELIWQPLEWGGEMLDLLKQNFYPTAHLWFLFYLMLYYALVVIFGRFKLSFGISPLLVITAILLLMIFCYQWHAEWIIKNPLMTRVEGATFLYYGLFFGLGWVAAQHGIVWLDLARKYRWLFLAGWIVLCGVAPWLQTFQFAVLPLQWNYMHMLATSVASIQTLYGLIAFTGLLHHGRPLTQKGKWLVESSYWVYLTHMPILMLCQLLLLPLAMPLFIKFMVALGISLSICFLSFEWIGRRWLNKLKPLKKVHDSLP